LIQHELWRSSSNIHLAIWASAGIFSAIHFQFYGFVPRVLLGALFGYLYYWSGNLLIPIFSHFINNGFIVLMVYLNQNEMTTIDIEDGEAAPFTVVLAGAVISMGLLYYIWKNHRDIQKKEENNSFSGNGPLS
jgi:zinc transporter ZupT